MTQQVPTILGSTDSIGMNTLNIISRHPEKFRVFALVGHGWVEKLVTQCAQSAPEYAVVANVEHAVQLEALLEAQNSRTRVLHEARALIDVASADEVDGVMYAIVGVAELPSALAVVQKGKTIYLTNRETLVVSDTLFMETAWTNNVRALPVDSEHNTVFQVLPRNYTDRPNGHGIRSIILTASGDPFPDADLAGFKHITSTQAVKHLNWSMGRKVSVDSATMMSRDLELIEVHWLLDRPPDNLGAVIRPQSVVYSIAHYLDGPVLARLGNPDIHTPITYCLGLPERIESRMGALDFDTLSTPTFRRPDFGRFPCLKLTYDTTYADGPTPYVLSAANEMTVATFLDGKTCSTDIARVMMHCLDAGFSDGLNDIENLLTLDARARVRAQKYAENLN